MARFARWAFLVALLSCRSVAAQDVRVLASVDRNTVGMDETVTYTLEIQGSGIGAVVRPEPPDAEGLVLSQPFPSQSSQTSIVNGVVSQSIGFTWYLRPVREGNARIAPVRVRVGDRDFVSEAIAVKVVPHGSGRPPAARQDPFAAFRTPTLDPGAPAQAAAPDAEDLFIRVTPSKRSALQGEQVVVRYDLFFREGIQLRQSRLTDSWDAEGFWREELDVDSRPVPRTVVENGLRYNTITLKRAAVFPTRSGELSIDALKIETEAVLPSRTRDPISRLFALNGRFVPIELASAPLTVRVEPLPAPPPSFKGAVGQYRMAVRFDRTEVPAGGSVTLTVTLSGTGNIATLAAPTFSVPGAFERYEPRETVEIDRSGDVLRGSKSFEYVLVARSHGRFEIPGIPFTAYDPAAGRWASTTSDPVVITVTGSGDALPVARATSGGLPVDDIAGPLLEDPDWFHTDRTPLHRSPWPYALVLVPALAVTGLWFDERRRRRLAADPALARRKRAHPLARKHLARAASLLETGQARPYYEELARALTGFAADRLDLSEHGVTRERLAGALVQSGVDASLAERLVAFLDACDLARFSPVVPPQARMEEDRDTAADLLVRLDDAFRA